jgi:tetratricopeptide (TPR) repeat protein
MTKLIAWRPRSARESWAAGLLAVAAITAVVALVVLRGGESNTFAAYDRMIADLEAQVIETPGDLEVRVSLAAAYLGRERLDAAIAQYREVLAAEPEHQKALVGLGRALMEVDDYDAAEVPLLKVVELWADNEFKYTVQALAGVHYDLAVIALDRGDLEEARTHLGEATKTDAGDSDTWRLVGDVERQLGNPAAAEIAYFIAVRYVPDYIEVYRALEELYADWDRPSGTAYAQGMIGILEDDLDLAVERLEAAIAADPGMASAHEGLGIAFEKSDRDEEALAAYRAALDLSPELFLSSIAVQRLEAR